MDHDLGLHDADPDDLEAVFHAGPNPEGTKLVKWMCEYNKVPEKVTIHSWNPDGAKRMLAIFITNGHHHVVLAPYQVKK